MLRIVLFFCYLFLACSVHAQGVLRQQGYVRTVGRPENKGGKRLSGVVIKVSGQHNTVLSGKDGKFVLAFNGIREGKDAFSFTSVRLAGYDLQEKEILGRRYAVSSTVPVEIVLVPQALKRQIEEKVRRTVENEYQKKLRRIEQLRQKDAVRYQQQLQLLEAEYDKRDQLVNEMVERYASTDYARLDELSIRINQFIESGELECADSLINTQDMVRMETDHAALRYRSEKLREDLDHNKKAEEASARQLMALYEGKRDIHLARFENDSAAYYWEKIVSLDSTNVENVLGAGEFMAGYTADQLRAMQLYESALRNAIIRNGKMCYEVVRCYNDMAAYHKDKFHLNQWRESLLNALHVLQDGFSDELKPQMAECFIQLGQYYCMFKDYKKSKDEYTKALGFIELAGNLPTLEADAWDGVGDICYGQNDWGNALVHYKHAMDIRLKAFGDEHPSLVASYKNLARINVAQNATMLAVINYSRAESIALKTIGKLNVPLAQVYLGLASVYDNDENYSKALEYYKSALNVALAVYGENSVFVFLLYQKMADVYYHLDDMINYWECEKKKSELRKTIELNGSTIL